MSCVQSGRKVFLDFLVHCLELGNFLSVNHFFYSLSVFVLYRNLRGNGNCLVIVFFLSSKCDKTVNNLLYFLCSCLCGNDFAIIDERCYLISK